MATLIVSVGKRSRTVIVDTWISKSITAPTQAYKGVQSLTHFQSTKKFSDNQTTRQEVLIAQGEAIRLDAEGCRVASGVWQGPYTGQRFTDPSDLHVDHIVPLAEAHESGVATWSTQRRRVFANDRDNLLAVEAGENMSKGADDPAEWLPPTGQCAYINQWVTVKVDYGLTADRAEQQAIERVAAGCQ